MNEEIELLKTLINVVSTFCSECIVRLPTPPSTLTTTIVSTVEKQCNKQCGLRQCSLRCEKEFSTRAKQHQAVCNAVAKCKQTLQQRATSKRRMTIDERREFIENELRPVFVSIGRVESSSSSKQLFGERMLLLCCLATLSDASQRAKFLYESANNLRLRVAAMSPVPNADVEIIRLLQLSLSSVENDDLQGRASVQAALGMQLLSVQNVEEGLPLLVESTRLFESLGEPKELALSLSNVARAYELSARFGDAVRTYESLHALHVRQQNFEAALNAQTEKANCLCSERRASDALTLMEQSVLPRIRKFGLTPSLANALCVTARALAECDRKSEALNMYQDAKRAFIALHKT